jgi:hypothetical protein
MCVVPLFDFDFVLDLRPAIFSSIVLLQCCVCFKILLLLTPVFSSREARVPLAIFFSLLGSFVLADFLPPA